MAGAVRVQASRRNLRPDPRPVGLSLLGSRRIGKDCRFPAQPTSQRPLSKGLLSQSGTCSGRALETITPDSDDRLAEIILAYADMSEAQRQALHAKAVELAEH